MGKTKPTFTPHVDAGDFVIVVNAEKVAVTGRKAEQKVYRHHTGYVGNLVERPFKQMIETRPEEVIELAVRRMLPKTRLGKTDVLEAQGLPRRQAPARRPEARNVQGLIMATAQSEKSAKSPLTSGAPAAGSPPSRASASVPAPARSS